MNALKLAASTLVLVMYFSVTSATQPDYSPCTYGNLSQVNCIGLNASDVLEAFRRNKNHADVKQLYLFYIPDITDDILGEVLDIVASTAADNVEIISLYGLDRVKNVPSALRKFTSLKVLYIWEMDGIETLAKGSMTLSSNNLSSIRYNINPHLDVIEPGAFQGNFDNTIIVLDHNNISKLKETVFKPLLTESTARVSIFGNPIRCDCNLAWIFRDGAKLLPRIQGDCKDQDQKVTKFVNIDSKKLLKSC